MSTTNNYQFNGTAKIPENNDLVIGIEITGDDCAVWMGKIVTTLEGLGIKFSKKSNKEIKIEVGA